jgi:hypothetical protein
MKIRTVLTRRVIAGLSASALASAALVGIMAQPASAASFSGSNLGIVAAGNSNTAPDYGAAREVTFDVSGVVGVLTNVEVSMTFNPGASSWVGAMDAVLVAPNGTTHTVFSRTGATGNGDNFPGYGDNSNLAGPYTFSDNAPATPTWWAAAAGVDQNTSVPSGSYRSSAAGGPGGTGANTLITPAFAGVANANGTWKLRLRNGVLEPATITAATLTVDGAGACAGAPITILGTSGPDAIIGTTGDDVIATLGGDDSVSAVEGSDIVCGGDGNDILRGGDGNDKLYGDAGNDTLKGGRNRDKCKGGPGTDRARKCERVRSVP